MRRLTGPAFVVLSLVLAPTGKANDADDALQLLAYSVKCAPKTHWDNKFVWHKTYSFYGDAVSFILIEDYVGYSNEFGPEKTLIREHFVKYSDIRVLFTGTYLGMLPLNMKMYNTVGIDCTNIGSKCIMIKVNRTINGRTTSSIDWKSGYSYEFCDEQTQVNVGTALQALIDLNSSQK